VSVFRFSLFVRVGALGRVLVGCQVGLLVHAP